MAGEVMRMPSREVDRRPDGGEAAASRPRFIPRSDVFETPDRIFVVAEMPGVGPNDVDVTLERRVLTIRGRTPKFEHEGYERIYAEYEEGDYERVFTISEDIDRENIKAAQKDGLLVLELPKTEPAKAKRIEVRGS